MKSYFLTAEIVLILVSCCLLCLLQVFIGSTLLDVSKQEVLFRKLCFTYGRNLSDRQAYISALCTEYERFVNSKFLNSHTHADSASSSLQGRLRRTGFKNTTGTRKPVQSAHLYLFWQITPGVNTGFPSYINS